MCTHRIVADAATQARRCNHGPRATPAHCGSGRSAYQSPVDVGKHEGKHEGTAATLRPAREGGAACHTPGSLWPPRLHFYYYLYFSGKNDITPQYLWVSNSTPTSSPWKILLKRASHVSGTVTRRRGVGRLAGLSIPLAPVQWSGFVAWGAIPSTRVHPCFPALYPGQGGLGTSPWGTFPCSSLSCTTTAVGGSSVG